jgi:UDP-N-acetylglucosamine 2-epimerase (non-hydrolysing)
VSPKTVHLIAAARPNFMKVALLYHALGATGAARSSYTGSTTRNMSDAFFRDLRLPPATTWKWAAAATPSRPDAP